MHFHLDRSHDAIYFGSGVFYIYDKTGKHNAYYAHRFHVFGHPLTVATRNVECEKIYLAAYMYDAARLHGRAPVMMPYLGLGYAAQDDYILSPNAKRVMEWINENYQDIEYSYIRELLKDRYPMPKTTMCAFSYLETHGDL